MKHLLGGIPLLVCLLIDVVIIITESLNLTLAVVCRLLTSQASFFITFRLRSQLYMGAEDQ